MKLFIDIDQISFNTYPPSPKNDIWQKCLSVGLFTTHPPWRNNEIFLKYQPSRAGGTRSLPATILTHVHIQIRRHLGGQAKFAKDTFSFKEPLYKKSTWQQEKKKKIGTNNGPPTSLPVDARTSINCNADAHAKIVLSCCYFC